MMFIIVFGYDPYSYVSTSYYHGFLSNFASITPWFQCQFYIECIVKFCLQHYSLKSVLDYFFNTHMINYHEDVYNVVDIIHTSMYQSYLHHSLLSNFITTTFVPMSESCIVCIVKFYFNTIILNHSNTSYSCSNVFFIQ